LAPVSSAAISTGEVLGEAGAPARRGPAPAPPAILGGGGRLVSVAEEPAGEGVYFVVEPNREQLAGIARLADSGDLRPLVDSVFPLGDAPAAFERVMRPGKRGKVVLWVVGD
jgi:NADPH:quinone reductase-like Zn-dependent oxidoreductase